MSTLARRERTPTVTMPVPMGRPRFFPLSAAVSPSTELALAPEKSSVPAEAIDRFIRDTAKLAADVNRAVERGYFKLAMRLKEGKEAGYHIALGYDDSQKGFRLFCEERIGVDLRKATPRRR